MNFYAWLLKSILQLNLSEIKRNPIFRTYIILEIAQETKHFNVMLFNFCLYISSVNKIRVAPSVCNVKSRLRTVPAPYLSNNLPLRSKHQKISLAWLRIFFTLFKFICSYITKPTTPNDVNFARDELRNFPTKFDVKFTTSFRSSQFD